MWRGRTRAEDEEAYGAYLEATGMRAVRALAGNRGTLVLRRHDGNTAEFITILLWESLEDIRAFAGDDLERAMFFPEDDRFLIEREHTVRHYDVDAAL